jgi:Flavin containing amine oxidoreductase
MVATTYSKILEKVAKPALEQADVYLSEEVIRIEYLGEDHKESGRILIETASSMRQICDHAVITAPLGWLKRNKESFFPPMPQELSDAINSVAYSRLEKVFFHFQRAWWEGNQDGLGDPNRYASEVLWARPGYAPETNPGRWNQEIFSCSAFPPEIAHPTMWFYIYGDHSKFVTEALQGLSPESKEYQDTLEILFKPYYSLLPHYDESNPDCKPTKVLSTDWEHDKFASCGAYTHYAVPLKDGAKTVSIIRDRMGNERNIWFAGEHTAPDIALSTIVGAYWSGERVAKEIMMRSGVMEYYEHKLQYGVKPDL